MMNPRRVFFVLAAALALESTGAQMSAADERTQSLEGTWTMTAAYEITVDGQRTTNYGEHPKGMLVIDAQGRYSLQIFRPDRARFAAGVKAQGTLEELRAAVVGSSTHFGRVEVKPAQKQLVFRIEASSYPNWEGTEQVRDYTLKDGTLTYAVPASASGNGTLAYSVWQRAERIRP